MPTTITNVRYQVARLAAVLDQPLQLDAYSPGDGWTRYRVVRDGSTPFGSIYSTGAELVDKIVFAIWVADALDHDTTQKRLTDFYTAHPRGERS